MVLVVIMLAFANIGFGSNNFGGQHFWLPVYLSKDSLEASISSAKSSEINVLVPGAEPDGD